MAKPAWIGSRLTANVKCQVDMQTDAAVSAEVAVAGGDQSPQLETQKEEARSCHLVELPWAATPGKVFFDVL
jgi:hypothetical protein